MDSPAVQIWDEGESGEETCIKYVEVHATWNGETEIASRVSYQVQAGFLIRSLLSLVNLTFG